MNDTQFANLIRTAKEVLENMIERATEERKRGEFPHELLQFCEVQLGDPGEVANLINGK